MIVYACLNKYDWLIDSIVIVSCVYDDVCDNGDNAG